MLENPLQRIGQALGKHRLDRTQQRERFDLVPINNLKGVLTELASRDDEIIYRALRVAQITPQGDPEDYPYVMGMCSQEATSFSVKSSDTFFPEAQIVTTVTSDFGYITGTFARSMMDDTYLAHLRILDLSIIYGLKGSRIYNGAFQISSIPYSFANDLERRDKGITKKIQTDDGRLSWIKINYEGNRSEDRSSCIFYRYDDLNFSSSGIEHVAFIGSGKRTHFL